MGFTNKGLSHLLSGDREITKKGLGSFGRGVLSGLLDWFWPMGMIRPT